MKNTTKYSNKSNTKGFDKLAPKYDIGNRVASLGFDKSWRRKMVSLLPTGKIKVADLACGTGDVAITAAKARPEAAITGFDLSDEMMSFGREKVEKAGFSGRIQLLHGDALNIDAPDSSFDAVTMSFGLRNMPSLEGVFKETRRIIKPDGVAVFMEFSRPQNRFLRFWHGVYLRHILPRTTYLATGNAEMLKYLVVSIMQFPEVADVQTLMRECGFKSSTIQMMFGAVTIYKMKPV
ncbi:MAG TPA: ubiquinone/menaquinone biosynthesis methyltransferase [Caldisericia bacterium]|nr:ubiquinone/menaquinone biosynthesis methyltransferase [Caldisericia bacterium]HPI84316.1 ubiquinone/menaquinone biosynthesis methyltransferase [Caldisericia bacterium]HPQ93743.1 ubiquinone/menaquinone biosynthesis methyltransferase [Caldisericia bacterium]HRV74833.1 ubiquinone/menaquinone biosynthesis methyltransferase [Caldisericia bacterium]